MRLAAIDLGSNSFHLLVVEGHPDGSFDTILREKEMLRLGDLVAQTGGIPKRDVHQAVDTVRRFAAMAHAAGAEEVVAFGTSALREAENSAEVVDRIADEAGVIAEVISGKREAELIFSAVQASVDIDPGPALVLDLGGGSAEVMIGTSDKLQWSTSLHLGVGRLDTGFVTTDPPAPDELDALWRHVTTTLRPAVKAAARLEPTMFVGTSGTLCAIARIVDVARTSVVPKSVNQLRIRRRDIQELHEELISVDAAKRASTPGLDAKRVDQIAVGTTVLLAAMKAFAFDAMVAGEWALREGMVIEVLRHHDVADWSGDAVTMRRGSVVGLARRCHWDETHSTHVARLAQSLFDQTTQLHGLGDPERELLEYAALLHDIGEHVAVESHHKHTAYLIEHGKLRGFDPDDIAVLGTLGRFHRRSDPKSSYEPFDRLSARRQQEALKLLALLRIADGLDRGHRALVSSVRVVIDRSRVRLHVAASEDVDLEIWGLRRKRGLFEKVFDCTLDVVAADHPSVAQQEGRLRGIT